MIHFKKNIFTTKPKYSSTQKRKLGHYTYAHIKIHRPVNKPHSLFFTIEDGKTTDMNNANKYNAIIQEEMDVIITVLNRMFNEDNSEYYIGNYYEVHNYTVNNVIPNSEQKDNIPQYLQQPSAASLDTTIQREKQRIKVLPYNEHTQSYLVARNMNHKSFLQRKNKGSYITKPSHIRIPSYKNTNRWIYTRKKHHSKRRSTLKDKKKITNPS